MAHRCTVHTIMASTTPSRQTTRKQWPIDTRMELAEVDLDTHDAALQQVLADAKAYTDGEVKDMLREISGLRETTLENTYETRRLRQGMTALTLTVFAGTLALCGSLVLVALRVG